MESALYIGLQNQSPRNVQVGLRHIDVELFGTNIGAESTWCLAVRKH